MSKRLEELKRSVGFRFTQNASVIAEYMLEKIEAAYKCGYTDGIKAAKAQNSEQEKATNETNCE